MCYFWQTPFLWLAQWILKKELNPRGVYQSCYLLDIDWLIGILLHGMDAAAAAAVMLRLPLQPPAEIHGRKNLWPCGGQVHLGRSGQVHLGPSTGHYPTLRRHAFWEAEGAQKAKRAHFLTKQTYEKWHHFFALAKICSVTTECQWRLVILLKCGLQARVKIYLTATTMEVTQHINKSFLATTQMYLASIEPQILPPLFSVCGGHGILHHRHHIQKVNIVG